MLYGFRIIQVQEIRINGLGAGNRARNCIVGGNGMADVTIYTKPGCPYCAAAKADFERRGVKFREINAQGDPKALEEMLKLNGGRRNVPTIVEDGKVTVGFGGS